MIACLRMVGPRNGLEAQVSSSDSSPGQNSGVVDAVEWSLNTRRRYGTRWGVLLTSPQSLIEEHRVSFCNALAFPWRSQGR